MRKLQFWLLVTLFHWRGRDAAFLNTLSQWGHVRVLASLWFHFTCSLSRLALEKLAVHWVHWASRGVIGWPVAVIEVRVVVVVVVVVVLG